MKTSYWGTHRGQQIALSLFSEPLKGILLFSISEAVKQSGLLPLRFDPNFCDLASAFTGLLVTINTTVSTQVANI